MVAAFTRSLQASGNVLFFLVYSYDPTIGGPRDLGIADRGIQGDILGLTENYCSTRPGYKLLRVAGGTRQLVPGRRSEQGRV